MANMNQQLRELVKRGYRAEDIAGALRIDVGVVELAIQQLQQPSRKVTVTELIESFKPRAVEILMEIAEDGDAKPADRVKACQILVNGEGQLPEVNAFDIGNKMLQFQQAVNKARQIKTIEAEVVPNHAAA